MAGSGLLAQSQWEETSSLAGKVSFTPSVAFGSEKSMRFLFTPRRFPLPLRASHFNQLGSKSQAVS